MTKNELLFQLNDAPKNSKILITTIVDDKMITVPVTSAFVVKDPRHVLNGEIRIQCNETHDAYAAFVSVVGVKEGTVANFERRYAGTWRTRESFARHHFDNTYPGLLPEVRPFINISAYSVRIFSIDFTAFHHNDRIFVFKILE